MPVEDPEPLIGAVKNSARLKLDENISFLDGHQLCKISWNRPENSLTPKINTL
jgi:hypothetical protein